MKSPKCFIIYSWESEEHQEWVKKLAECLQKNGVDTSLDRWDVRPGMKVTEYMESSIRDSNYVLLVCTPTFAKKANAGEGGVGYEKSIVTGKIFSQSAVDTKFTPILRKGNAKTALPSYLKDRVFIDFRNDIDFDISLNKLLKHIFEETEYKRPPLGKNPSLKLMKNQMGNLP